MRRKMQNWIGRNELAVGPAVMLALSIAFVSVACLHSDEIREYLVNMTWKSHIYVIETLLLMIWLKMRWR